MKPLTLTTLLTATLLACSTQPPAPPKAIHPINSVALYMARGDLLAAPQFEQYKLSNNKLFGECGKVLKAGPVAAAQDLSQVDPQQLASINAAASEIIELLKSEESNLSEPGGISGFMASGKLEITIQSGDNSSKLETSLNSIAEPSSLAEKRVHNLVELLRGTAPNQCGNRQFFGIGSKRTDTKE